MKNYITTAFIMRKWDIQRLFSRVNVIKDGFNGGNWELAELARFI